jgi:hypothetical protein
VTVFSQNEEFYLLGHTALKSAKSKPMFWTKMSPPSSILFNPFNCLHRVISSKTELFIANTKRTSNPFHRRSVLEPLNVIQEHTEDIITELS